MNPVQIQKYTCNASIAFGKKKGHLNASQLKESQLARPDTRNRVIRSIYFLELKKKKFNVRSIMIYRKMTA